jgi:hypothetical protein
MKIENASATGDRGQGMRRGRKILREIEGVHMEPRNRNVAVQRMRPSANAKPIPMTVLPRQQAPEEQRRFRAATDALLTELVRRQMGRGDIRDG